MAFVVVGTAGAAFETAGADFLTTVADFFAAGAAFCFVLGINSFSSLLIAVSPTVVTAGNLILNIVWVAGLDYRLCKTNN